MSAERLPLKLPDRASRPVPYALDSYRRRRRFSRWEQVGTAAGVVIIAASLAWVVAECAFWMRGW